MHAQYAGRWRPAVALKAHHAGRWKDGTCYVKKRGRWVLAWPQVDVTYTLRIGVEDRDHWASTWTWTVPAGVYKARMGFYDPWGTTDRVVAVAPGGRFTLQLWYRCMGFPLPGTYDKSFIQGRGANGAEVIIRPNFASPLVRLRDHFPRLPAYSHIKIQTLPPD